MKIYKKILGGLIGAAAGDAMGAATEARTTEQILEYFGHVVTDFETPPKDTFARGNKKGQVTDDFSSAYFMAESIVENDGIVSEDAVKKALIEWSTHAVFFDRFAGPTTRLAIKKYKGEKIEESKGVKLVSRQATNGSAMRISPIGLINAGDIDKTIYQAIKATIITHDNYLALSGASAVAAAVSAAFEDKADLYSILQAGLYGAKEGERIGRKIAKDVAGPSVVRRMEMAIDIGLGKGTPWEKMIEIGHRIGAGLHVAEAIPTAFGLVAANKGDAMGSIVGGVNIGYDTDTIATMSGAIAGTLNGEEAFPSYFLEVLEQANNLDISGLAKKIQPIAKRNLALKNGGYLDEL